MVSAFLKNARLALVVSVGATAILCGTPAAAQARDYDIPSQSAERAVATLAKQGNVQILLPGRTARGVRTKAVHGSMSIEEALNAMLAGTGLRAQKTGAQTWTIIPFVEPKPAQAKAPQVSGEGEAGSAAADDESARLAAGTPEILITGSRTNNADIRRTEDDAQPYVVLGRDEIRRSQATTLDDFFKTRLPMNNSSTSLNQIGTNQAGTSQIDLRGLGTGQTLILIDGRRTANISFVGSFRQANIDGLPLSAIDRIEVLPSTASGIYGGGATGGVINVITRKDYSGGDLAVTYGQTFRDDAANFRIDGSIGFALEGGKTRVRLAGSYSEADHLDLGDRDFVARSRALQLANNPSAFTTPTTPPLGRLTNIRAVNGSNLILDNGTALGSPITFVPAGYSGVTSDNGAALAANAGKYDLGLPDTVAASGARSNLLGLPSTRALSLDVRREFGSHLQAFADLSWTLDKAHSFGANVPTSVTLAANATNNPFTTPITVTFPATGIGGPLDVRNETYRATTGVIVKLSRDWTAGLDYVWSETRYSYTNTDPIVGDPDGAGPGASVTTALTNSTLDVVRDLNAFPLNFEPYLMASPNVRSSPQDNVLNDVTLRLSGPLIRLPAGPVVLTTAAEYRKESAAGSYLDQLSASAVASTTYTAPRSQSVASVYGELLIPIVSRDNALSFVHSLTLQGSVRHDDYRTASPVPDTAVVPSQLSTLPAFATRRNKVAATGYTLSLKYEPVEGVILRASRGTGFLPPSVNQIVSRTPINITSGIVDPKRGGAAVPGTALLLSGGNAALTAERSKSWSLGVVLQPRLVPGLRLSADYTRIIKTGEIAAIGIQPLLDLEDSIPGRITRAALTPADQALGYTGGVVTQIDNTLANVSGTELEAIDFQADYAIETQSLGSFRFNIVATWEPRISRQVNPSLAFIDSSGFNGGVLEWRGNGGITWEKGPWSFAWNAQYYDSYFTYSSTSSAASIATTILSNGRAKIPSQIYHDLLLGYRFGESGLFAPLKGLELTLGIQNLFDHSPPIRASTTTFGTTAYSTYGDPRLRRFTINLRKHF